MGPSDRTTVILQPEMFLILIMLQEILPGARVAPVDYQAAIPELVRLFLYGVVPRSEDHRDEEQET